MSAERLDGVVIFAQGEIFSFQKEAKLTALEDVVIGVPIHIVAGEASIGSLVHCDDDVEMWTEAGAGHPSLGPCILIALSAGKSVSLAKASQAVASSPKDQKKSSMRFQLEHHSLTGDPNTQFSWPVIQSISIDFKKLIRGFDEVGAKNEEITKCEESQTDKPIKIRGESGLLVQAVRMHLMQLGLTTGGARDKKHTTCADWFYES